MFLDAKLSPHAAHFVAVAFLLLAAAGCRPKSPPLPTYDWVDDATAIHRIAERAASIQTVSSTCSLTLTRPDGQSVALDGIMVIAPPDKLRLAASKFGQKLFDLTLNPDGLFIRVDDPSRKDKVVPASLSAARFVREWSLFNGGLFQSPDLTTQNVSSTMFLVSRPLPDGRRVVCEVDKPTLTPRIYHMYDPAGVERFTLKVPDYLVASGIVYPAKMLAHSEQGDIDIEMREVELNIELPPAAFTPPNHAEKQP